MITVNIHDAKTNLSALVEKARLGEKIIVCKRNIPMVELTPVAMPKRKRAIGLYPHKFDIPEEAFAPMTDEEFEEFTAGPLE